MFDPKYFNGKLVASKGLAETIKDRPELYKLVSQLCALSQVGVSERERDFAREKLEDLLGPEAEVIVEIEPSYFKFFWTNKLSKFWQYASSFPRGYIAFFDSQRKANFIPMN